LGPFQSCRTYAEDPARADSRFLWMRSVHSERAPSKITKLATAIPATHTQGWVVLTTGFQSDSDNESTPASKNMIEPVLPMPSGRLSKTKLPSFHCHIGSNLGAEGWGSMRRT